MQSVSSFIQQYPEEAIITFFLLVAVVVCLWKMVEILLNTDVVVKNGVVFSADDVCVPQRAKRALDRVK